jgi:hypothetical protein
VVAIFKARVAGSVFIRGRTPVIPEGAIRPGTRRKTALRPFPGGHQKAAEFRDPGIALFQPSSTLGDTNPQGRAPGFIVGQPQGFFDKVIRAVSNQVLKIEIMEASL